MQPDNPELVVDISRTIDVKARAFCCHASQIGDTAAAEASIRERAARFGRPYGVAFAEYFDRVPVPSSSQFLDWPGEASRSGTVAVDLHCRATRDPITSS